MNKIISERIYSKLNTYQRPCYDEAGIVMNNVNFIDITKVDNIVLHESSHELNELIDNETLLMRNELSENTI